MVTRLVRSYANDVVAPPRSVREASRHLVAALVWYYFAVRLGISLRGDGLANGWLTISDSDGPGHDYDEPVILRPIEILPRFDITRA